MKLLPLSSIGVFDITALLNLLFIISDTVIFRNQKACYSQYYIEAEVTIRGTGKSMFCVIYRSSRSAIKTYLYVGDDFRGCLKKH